MNPLDNKGIYITKKKDYFGDIEVLLKVNRKYSAVCKVRCEFLVFSIQLLSRIKKLHPNVWYELKNVARERLYVLDRSMLRIEMLRALRRTHSRSETQIAEFQTYQRIKRDMKNATHVQVSVKGFDVGEEDVVLKILEMEQKLKGLKKNIDLLKENRGKK
jgi:CRP-like cAMP-binding protein